MSIRTTKSRIFSTPVTNNPFFFGESDTVPFKEIPTEVIEVRSANIIPANPAPLISSVPENRLTPNDLSKSIAITISKFQNNVNFQRKNNIEERLKLVTGQSEINIDKNSERSTSQRTNRRNNLNNPYNNLNDEEELNIRCESNSAAEDKLNLEELIEDESVLNIENSFEVLSVFDFSNFTKKAIDEKILAKQIETELDEKLLNSLFSNIKQNKNNANYLYELENQIKNEISQSEEILNNFSYFNNSLNKVNNSLNISNNNNSFYNKFQLLNNNSDIERKNNDVSNFCANDFIKLFEKLNAVENTAGLDSQYVIWKSYLSLKQYFENGISNLFVSDLSEESNNITEDKNINILEYYNFEYNGTNFNEFNEKLTTKISNPLNKIYYYINIICNELNNSIGLGILEADSETNGADWLKNFGINENNDSIFDNEIENNFYEPNFISINGQSKKLFGINEEDALNFYLNNIKNNTTENIFFEYDNALVNANNNLKKFEKAINTLTNSKVKNKKLLNPTKLFIKIIETFNKLIANIENEDQNYFNLTEKENLFNLALLNLTAGKVSGTRLNLKINIFNNICKLLLKIRDERKSAEKKLFINENLINIESNIDNFLSDIATAVNKNFNNRTNLLATDLNDEEINDFYKNLTNSNLKENIVFHNILELFLEIEKECIDLINKELFEVNFLNENEKTKFSNLDSTKFIFILYEIFGLLSQIFLKAEIIGKINLVSITAFPTTASTPVSSTAADRIQRRSLTTSLDADTNKSDDRLLSRSQPETSPSTVLLETIRWKICSDEVKTFLKELPEAIEKDNFELAFESFKTLTIGDNLGVANNNINFPITARNFYDLNENFKVESTICWDYLNMIKTVVESFYQKTRNINQLARILSGDTNISDANLSEEQKNLKKLLSIDINKKFFNNISKLKLERARLRLDKIKKLNYPYNLTSVNNEIFELLKFYVKEKNYFNEKNKIVLISINQKNLDSILNTFNEDKILAVELKKINELQDIKYKEKLIFEGPLNYILTKEILSEALIEDKSTGLNNFSSISNLLNKIKLINLNDNTQSNFSADQQKEINNNYLINIIESYLNCILIELLTKIDFDVIDNFNNQITYNFEVARNILEMAGEILDIDLPFELLFKADEDNQFILKSKAEIQANINNGASFYSNNETFIHFNDEFDFYKINLLHSILDTIYVRKDKIKEMIFGDIELAQIYGISFNANNFEKESRIKDNLIRFDSFYFNSAIK
jgi:hypothetical protein